jgi:hypothetical protein
MRVFVDAISGSEVAITGDNVGNLMQLCGKFEFKAFAEKVDDWRLAHVAVDADARREL